MARISFGSEARGKGRMNFGGEQRGYSPPGPKKKKKRKSKSRAKPATSYLASAVDMIGRRGARRGVVPSKRDSK